MPEAAALEVQAAQAGAGAHVQGLQGRRRHRDLCQVRAGRQVQIAQRVARRQLQHQAAQPVALPRPQTAQRPRPLRQGPP